MHKTPANRNSKTREQIHSTLFQILRPHTSPLVDARRSTTQPGGVDSNKETVTAGQRISAFAAPLRGDIEIAHHHNNLLILPRNVVNDFDIGCGIACSKTKHH